MIAERHDEFIAAPWTSADGAVSARCWSVIGEAGRQRRRPSLAMMSRKCRKVGQGSFGEPFVVRTVAGRTSWPASALVFILAWSASSL
jgi:hypothetical protein